MAKLTEKTRLVLNYVRENDKGEGVLLSKMAEDLGMKPKQIGPIVWTTLKEKKDGSRPSLVRYEKKTVKGEDQPVGYVFITEAGKTYEDPEEEVAE